MQYLLLIYQNEAELAQGNAASRTQMMEEYRSFTQSIIQSGHFKAGDALQPSSTATTVRVREGKMLPTEGPFAETREQLGGYYPIGPIRAGQRALSRRAGADQARTGASAHHEPAGRAGRAEPSLRLPVESAGRTITPPFMTKVTCSSTAISSSGLPATAMISAK
jgi:hypothetical protein